MEGCSDEWEEEGLEGRTDRQKVALGRTQAMGPCWNGGMEGGLHR